MRSKRSDQERFGAIRTDGVCGLSLGDVLRRVRSYEKEILGAVEIDGHLEKGNYRPTHLEGLEKTGKKSRKKKLTKKVGI